MLGYDDLPDAIRTVRADAWVNGFTGFGTRRDKTTYGRFGADCPLTWDECAALFHYDDMGRKVASLLPSEALRMGWEIVGDDGTLAEEQRRLEVEQQITKGLTFGRAFGGAVLYLGADDGGAAQDALVDERVSRFSFLELYDIRRASPIAWYEDPRALHYGQPRLYQLSSLRGAVSIVHESRLIVFPGALTMDQEKYGLSWWDFSVFQSCYEAIRSFNESSKALELMMVEASQFVFSMAGLIGGLAQGQQQTIQQRMQLLDMSRSIARAIMLDASKNEKAERLAMSFSGVAEAWDRISIRLCAAANAPITKLLGRSPAGMNATGDSDIRNWYDEVKSYQRNIILPRIERIHRLIKRSIGVSAKTHIKFPSLWQESPTEQAERRLKTSQADSLDIAFGVLTAAEVATSRYGGEVYSSETKLAPGPRPQAAPPEVKASPGGVPAASATAALAPPAPAASPGDGGSGANSPIPGSELGPPMVDRHAKPGQGRLPEPQGPTTGNSWPSPITKPPEKT